MISIYGLRWGMAIFANRSPVARLVADDQA